APAATREAPGSVAHDPASPRTTVDASDATFASLSVASGQASVAPLNASAASAPSPVCAPASRELPDDGSTSAASALVPAVSALAPASMTPPPPPPSPLNTSLA